MTEIKVYIGIWVGLMAGTALEVVVRSLVGDAWFVVLLISVIAALQAIFVSLYYQNLRHEGIQVATLPLAAVVGIVFLAVAAGFSLAMGV